MKSKPEFPLICSHPGLSKNIREGFKAIWTSVPLPKRQRSDLPDSEWGRQYYGSSYGCFYGSIYGYYVNPAGQDAVWLAACGRYGDPDDPTSHDERPDFKAFADRRTLLLDFDRAITAIPSAGSILHVSESRDHLDYWASAVLAFLTGAVDPPEINHTQQSMIEHGLSFTDGYVNEFSHWLRCTVLAHACTDNKIHLLTEIESVIWNRPIDLE